MNPLIVQQCALDDALVAHDNHAIIGKCKMTIEATKTQKEVTYQVVLDALKLTACYKAFLFTVDVLEIYASVLVYGKLIPDVLVSKEMMESKAYKTYLDFAIGKVIPKEARNRTKAHIKETSLTANDNIIPDDSDAALELAKSISRNEAEEQEVARLVHETHERLVTKQSTRRRRQTGVTIRDTPTVTKKKTLE
ncbi:hypothetical protein Tco_1187042, partial [Tanacetum coccineum]